MNNLWLKNALRGSFSTHEWECCCFLNENNSKSVEENCEEVNLLMTEDITETKLEVFVIEDYKSAVTDNVCT